MHDAAEVLHLYIESVGGAESGSGGLEPEAQPTRRDVGKRGRVDVGGGAAGRPVRMRQPLRLPGEFHLPERYAASRHGGRIELDMFRVQRRLEGHGQCRQSGNRQIAVSVEGIGPGSRNPKLAGITVQGSGAHQRPAQMRPPTAQAQARPTALDTDRAGRGKMQPRGPMGGREVVEGDDAMGVRAAQVGIEYTGIERLGDDRPVGGESLLAQLQRELAVGIADAGTAAPGIQRDVPHIGIAGEMPRRGQIESTAIECTLERCRDLRREGQRIQIAVALDLHPPGDGAGRFIVDAQVRGHGERHRAAQQAPAGTEGHATGTQRRIEVVHIA